MKSEFGKGYSYCIGLFLMHAERKMFHSDESNKDYGLWFNGAGDHLYEFQPYNKKGREFKSKVLSLRLGKATEKEFEWAIKEAKELLMLWDKKNGVKVIKGDWE